MSILATGGWGKARNALGAVTAFSATGKGRPGRLEDKLVQLKREVLLAEEALRTHNAAASSNAFGASLADRKTSKALSAVVTHAMNAVNDEEAARLAEKAAQEQEYQNKFAEDNRLALEAEERAKAAQSAKENMHKVARAEMEAKRQLQAEEETKRTAAQLAAAKEKDRKVGLAEASSKFIEAQVQKNKNQCGWPIK